MTTTARQTTRSAARAALMPCLAAAAMLVPMAALAQANACDQLKALLAARIEATGVRGYSLEAVPAATPVPAGAKAIGNCEGGERKILYRRWGGASASAPPATVAAEPPPRPAPPLVRATVPTSAASVAAPAPAPLAKPEPAKAAPAHASAVDAVRPAPAIAPAAQAVASEPPAEKPPLSQQAHEFAAVNWRWLTALLLVPLAALGWAWRAHHLAYDKNGLPRGPRL